MTRLTRDLVAPILLTPVAIAAVISGACAQPSIPRTARSCDGTSPVDLYFAPDTFVPQIVDADDELRQTLARYLQAANERSWICGEVPTEGYRLFVGGGYGLPAIVVSISRTSSGWRTAVSEFERLTPGTAFQVAKHSTTDTPTVSSGDIRQSLQRASFWTTPTWQNIEGEGDIIMIETLDGADHRAVVQAVPTPEFRNAAQLILRATTESENFLQMRRHRK